MPTTWAMYIGRLSLKGTWKGILEVSAFLVYYITILCSSTSQITRTSQQVWRVHLVYVASGITSSRITQPCGPTSLPTGNRDCVVAHNATLRTDQPSYREPGPFGGCNFLTRRVFQPVAPHSQADRPTCRATSAGGQTNLSLPDMHQAQPKEGH